MDFALTAQAFATSEANLIPLAQAFNNLYMDFALTAQAFATSEAKFIQTAQVTSRLNSHECFLRESHLRVSYPHNILSQEPHISYKGVRQLPTRRPR